MTPEKFISTWKGSELNERQGAHIHFNDLCDLLDVPKPTGNSLMDQGYGFEINVDKTGGGGGFADGWKRNCFAWEYKSPGKNLNTALKQLRLYASDLENPPLLIVSDMRRIELHTNWTNMVQESHALELEDLADPELRQKLKWAFDEHSVEQLKPSRSANATTEEVAEKFVSIAQNLRDHGNDPEQVAHFVNRMVFCMFAEDVDLLPKRLFERMLEASLADPDQFVANAEQLFTAMAKQHGRVGYDAIDWFNGGLFEDGTALPMQVADIRVALEAARANWSEINPSIMGTLFERGLDPGKRSQLGAHYTDAEKIMTIIRPVIIEPLLREWEVVKPEIVELLKRSKEHHHAPTKTKLFQDARNAHQRFIERLTSFRVLDPACGSGNFLYLALKSLKDIEFRVNFEAEEMGLTSGLPQVGPECVKGIEINSFAAELARVSVWIGEIQWMRQHNLSPTKNPILKPLDTIECRDALLNTDGTEAPWPAADVIIGNPPFLGSKFMRKGRPANRKNSAIIGLGDAYVNQMFAAYAGAPPASANLVSYWFQKSLNELLGKTTLRIGLVATQSVRLGASNKPIANAVRDNRAEIYFAQQNNEWTIDGAEVRVSIICFRQPTTRTGGYKLDGSTVDCIHPDLTSGATLYEARPMPENSSLAFQGVKMNGPFNITSAEARELLSMPTNPNGLKNSEVVRRFAENDDVTMRDSDNWILDFTHFRDEKDAALFEGPFKIVQRVKEARAKRQKGQATETSRLDRYWLMQRSRTELRRAIAGLDRVIAVPETSEHRLFRFLDGQSVFSGSLFVIARDDYVTFGCLQSRPHEVWSSERGNRMGAGNQRRYNATRTFETFPFPNDLTPNIPASEYETLPNAIAISIAAKRLNELRENWLNPSELVVRVPEVVQEYPERILPVDENAATILKKRTLTNLYNERPAWLDLAHRELDIAVAAAYGWKDWGDDGLHDDVILERLFSLNQERAAKQ